MFPKRYHKVLAVGRKLLSAASPSGASWGAEAPRDEVLVVSLGTPWMGQEVAGDGQAGRGGLSRNHHQSQSGMGSFPCCCGTFADSKV